VCVYIELLRRSVYSLFTKLSKDLRSIVSRSAYTLPFRLTQVRARVCVCVCVCVAGRTGDAETKSL